MECTYTTIVDGKEVTFNSEMELDTFLKNRRSGYELDEVHKTFSTDPQAEALNKINEIKLDFDRDAVATKRINDDGDYETYLKIPYSISTTSLITEYGNPDNWIKPIVTPFNVSNWRNNKIEALVKEGMSQSDAKMLAITEETSWKVLTAYGNEVHNVLDAVINGKDPVQKQLSEQVFNKLKQDAQEFVKFIKNKHGQNAKLFPEISMRSKRLEQSFRTLLPNKDSINGRLDLLVIDDNGVAHVYDFKVSRKNVGDWDETSNARIAEDNTWHTTKKLSATYQLVFYKRMLEQYGFKVDSINVVPIGLDVEYESDNISIDKINSIMFDTNDIVSNMKNTSPGGRYYDNVAALLPIVVEKNDNVDLIEQMYNEFNIAFPNQTGAKVVKQGQAEFEYYKNKKANFWRKVNSDSKNYEKGYRYVFWKNETTKQPVFTKTEAELDEAIKEYVEAINNKKENELSHLADNLSKAINGNLTLDEVSNDDNNAKKLFINAHFGKYVDNMWEFMQNDQLNQAGIFIFQKNGQTEIVNITNKPIHTLNNLGLGHTILGRFKRDDRVNTKETLTASNGNIELMKMMFFVQNNPRMFENSRINTIKTVNIWHGSYIEHRNSQLIKNFRDIIFNVGKDLKFNLEERLFNDDVTALVNLCESYIRDGSRLKVVNFQVQNDAEKYYPNRRFILDKLNELRRNNPNLYTNDNANINDPDWLAYNYLNKALLALDNWGDHFELDPGQWVDQFRPIGLNTSSIQNSPSSNARQLGDIMNLYTNDIRQFQNKYISRYNKVFRNFYKDSNIPHVIGGEAKLFIEWFVPDSSGNINKNFMLKDPSDPSLQPYQAKALKTFLEIVNEIRFRGNDQAIENAKMDGTYYEVPLLEAKLNRQIKANGFLNALKRKTEENWNIVENVFKTQVQTKQQYERENKKLYNRFNISSSDREALINEYGIGAFETDLERVMREVIVQYAREEVSEKYVPVIQALKLSLKMQQALGGSKLVNVNEFIDKYLKKNLYGEPIIEKGLQPIYKFLSVFKSATSTLTLGLNARSGMREILQGSYIGLSRAFSGIYGNQFSSENYVKAFLYVGSEVRNSINDRHLIEWLNTEYGMANTGINELSEEARLNKLGLANFGSDQMFFTSKAPDMLHRMSMLVAKMYQEGTWDAHTLVDDVLTYDWKKDKRYEVYAKGNKNNKLYAEQRAVYLANMEQFNREGYMLQEGDDLPRAYTVREASSIKNFADLCYGHYDSETRALMNSMFLGSFIMQYKTFVTAKLEQWFLKPGIYNMEQLKQQFDPVTGEKLYRLITYSGPDNTGQPSLQIIKESDIRKGDLVEPYLEWEGIPVEGMAYSIASYAKAIFTLDQKGLEELWKDPLKRANLILFMHDMIWMMLFASLIQLAFEWDTLRDDKSWLKNWSAMVLYGSTQDGPIHNIIGALAGDLNPPTKTSIEKLIQTTGEVITGDENLWYAIIRNVGALREFQTVQRIF